MGGTNIQPKRKGELKHEKLDSQRSSKGNQ